MESSGIDHNEYMLLFGGLFKFPKNQAWVKQNKEMLCKQAHLHHNQHSMIINDVIHIKFPNLTLLHLANNKIMSIQALQHLHSPKLQKLHLSFNEFHKVKALRKCYFPKLQKLALMGTKIIDFDQLFELNFPKLISLIIQNTKDVHDIRLMNVNILAKFHPKTEKLFTLRKQRKSENALNCLLSKK